MNDEQDTETTPQVHVSRRAFLHGAGGGLLAAASLTSHAAAQETVPTTATGRPMPQMQVEPPIEPGRRVGYAIVGLGQYALNQILPSFAETRSSRLVALVSGNREKAEDVAGQYGVDPQSIYGYDDFDEIAQNDAIDVVYVIVPPALHADLSIRASRAGKHVLCEKPMAIDAAQCRSMIEAATEANRLLMIGYRAQFQPHNVEAIRIIADGELGTVRVIHTENATSVDPSIPSGQWRVQRSLAGGGSLFDVGIYGVNGARYLTGEEPTLIMASIDTPDDDRFGDVEDVVTWQMRFPSGITAVGSTSYSAPANRFGVAGTEASLELQPATDYYEHNLSVRTEEGTNEVGIEEGPSQFARMLDHLSEAVLNGTAVDTPGEEGMQDIRLLRAIYEAAESGSPVTVDWEYGQAD